jgi:hypothetical protein
VYVFLFVVLVALVVALVAGWSLLVGFAVWLIVKRPLLSLAIAVYIGLVVWLGGHDALALASYVVIVLGIWRLVHKRSFQRIAGPRLQRSWRQSWEHDRRLAHDRDAGNGRPPGLDVGCSAQQTQARTPGPGEAG